MAAKKPVVKKEVAPKKIVVEFRVGYNKDGGMYNVYDMENAQDSTYDFECFKDFKFTMDVIPNAVVVLTEPN